MGENREMNQERSDQRREPVTEAHGAPPDTPPLSGRVAILFIVVLLLVAVVLVVAGIVPRVRARTTLKDQTDALAAPDVIVNPPRPGKSRQEIILPANVYAYSDAICSRAPTVTLATGTSTLAPTFARDNCWQ